ncbi:MAG: DUF4912 domain-containing protein [Pseudomonadota bacterium]
MKKSDLVKYKKLELLDMGRKLDVPLTMRMKKEDMISFIVKESKKQTKKTTTLTALLKDKELVKAKKVAQKMVLIKEKNKNISLKKKRKASFKRDKQDIIAGTGILETVLGNTNIKKETDHESSKKEVEQSKFTKTKIVCEAEKKLPTDVPKTYLEDSLAILPVDPKWIFAYWELTKKSFDCVKKQAKDSKHKLLLRLYEVNKNNSGSDVLSLVRDIEINNHLSSWYANIEKTQTSYRAEIGIKTSSTFYPIIVSNTIFSPAEDVSNNIKQIWVSPKELDDKWEEISKDPNFNGNPESLEKLSEILKQSVRRNISSSQLSSNSLQR